MAQPTRRIYLDHNASTPLHPAVQEAMAASFGVFGNPSSIHQAGREARQWVERGRGAIAGAVGDDPSQIVLTGSGTESCSLGVVGLYRRRRTAGGPSRILVDPTAHPAVLGSIQGLVAEGAQVRWAKVDADGHIDAERFRREVADGVAMVALSLVNHELGTLAPVADLVGEAKRHGVTTFVDAVQGLGKVDVGGITRHADAVAMSGHKIYGPKGIGALRLAPGIDIDPIWPSGHQERGRRPGTENLIGVVGFGVAAGLLTQHREALCRVTELGETLLAALVDQGARDNGGPPRVSTTVNIGFEGCPGDVLVQALDLAGVSVSTGAACTSGTVKPSSVMLATGATGARAREAVRFSLGLSNTREEIDRVIKLMPTLVERVRKHS